LSIRQKNIVQDKGNTMSEIKIKDNYCGANWTLEYQCRIPYFARENDQEIDFTKCEFYKRSSKKICKFRDPKYGSCRNLEAKSDSFDNWIQTLLKNKLELIGG